MTKAILGTFVDARSVKSRSVMQIVIEIPIEQTDEALKALGGWPQPAESRWVGVALSKEERDKIAKLEKPHKKFGELELSARAAILCGEDDFLAYLNVFHPGTDDIAARVRSICRVESRSEFNTDQEAGNRWLLLESAYRGWQTEQRYKDVRR